MHEDQFEIVFLIRQLEDPETEVRERAERLIFAQGNDAIKALIYAFAPGSIVNSRIVDVLVRADDPIIDSYLIDSLNCDKPMVVSGVCEVLGKRKCQDSVPVLIKLLDDCHPLRKSIIDALGEIGNPQAIPQLVRFLSDRDLTVMYKATRALASFGNKSIQALRKAFKDSNLQIKYNAARAAGWINTNDLRDDLLELVKDEYVIVVKEATLALARLQDPTLKDAFVQLLNHDEKDVRRHAAYGLGKLHDSTTLGPLVKSLSDKATFVRVAAAEALGTLGDNRALEPLVHCLKDARGTVRQAAAYALGMIGDLRAYGPLVKAAEDKWEGVRFRAVEALGLNDSYICYVDHETNNLLNVGDFAAAALCEIGTAEAIAAVREWEADK